MDLSFRFDGWFKALPESPLDGGCIQRLVQRPAGGGVGARLTPERIRVEVGKGVIGDRRSQNEESSEGEVSLINVHVLRAVANDEDHMPMSGDNLQVDLNLSEANLPAGSHLHVGTAILKVSAQPHVPCGLFIERFGLKNTKRVARASRTGKRGRGVLCTVAQSGEIALGDAIRVVR
ncbi:MAG: hypothetical protein P1V35_16505 [Planctomycetota bacterium]|nr:hypothetical protein [Planctomycetota bacterium]